MPTLTLYETQAAAIVNNEMLQTKILTFSGTVIPLQRQCAIGNLHQKFLAFHFIRSAKIIVIHIEFSSKLIEDLL